MSVSSLAYSAALKLEKAVLPRTSASVAAPALPNESASIRGRLGANTTITIARTVDRKIVRMVEVFLRNYPRYDESLPARAFSGTLVRILIESGQFCLTLAFQ